MYFMSMNSRCGTYKTKKLKVVNSVLNFTVTNTELSPNCSYKEIIEAINKVGRINSTVFDIESERGG